MTLRSRRLERQLRRRVRQEVRRSPTLRRARRAQRSRVPTIVSAGWLFVVVPLALVFRYLSLERSVGYAVFVLTTYGLTSAFFRAWFLGTDVAGSPDLGPLLHLPVPDDQLFRHRWRREVRQSLWALFLFALLQIAMVAGPEGSVVRIVAALALAVAQWLVVLAAGALLARSLSAASLFYGWLGLAGAQLVALVWWESIGPRMLAPASRVLLAATPNGWVTYALLEGLVGGHPAAFAALLPALGLVVALPVLLASARGRFSTENIDPPPSTEEAAIETETMLEPAERGEDVGVAQAALKEARAERAVEAVRERRFLERLRWERLGVLERVGGAMLSERDRTVAEFLLGGKPHWTGRWRAAAVVGLIAVAVTLVLPRGSAWVLQWAIVLASLIAMPVLGGSWPGLSLHEGSTFTWPTYAGLPITHKEVCRVVWRADLVRVLAWLPVLVALGAVWGWRDGCGAATGAMLWGRIGCVALTALPFIVAVRPRLLSGSSLGMNDLLAVLGLVIPFVIYAPAAILFFDDLLPRVRVIATLVMLVVPLVTLWLHTAWGDRGRVDLVRPVKL